MGYKVYASDEDYLRGLKAADNVAIKSLYKLNYPMILNFVLNNSGDEDEAKDLYQEGFIAFYEQVGREGFVLTCKIKTYLYSICRRLWLKKLNGSARKMKKISDDDDYVDLGSDLAFLSENELKFELVGKVMDKLGEPCKSLITDFYIHDLNMNEISDKFGYTNSDNAKNQKYKCLQRLKKIFFIDYKESEEND